MALPAQTLKAPRARARPMRSPPALAALALVLAGCMAPPATIGDAVMALPSGAYYDANWDAGRGYHTLEQLRAHMDALAANHTDIVRVQTIGSSRDGLPILAFVLENRAIAGPKPAAFIDGGHHGNEVEGVEATVFLFEHLVTNYATNRTVRALVDGLETWIVPIVNVDGYVAQTRFNSAGVNLNRNYDLDWCDPLARNTCPPGPAHDATRPLIGPSPENAGTAPFSEPESSAIRDAVVALGDRVAFYLSHHTPAHCLAQPWTAPNPPFPVPAEHQATFDAVFAWVEGSTEYGGGTWTTPGGTCMNYQAGGASQDWAYATARKPSFTMEVAGSPEWEGVSPTDPRFIVGAPPYPRDLRHWVAATLPIELFFLHNAARLQAWGTDLASPMLPAGAPPEA